MKTMLLVVVFIFLSSYIGLFIRAKIEGVKIYKNFFDILSLPLYIIILPIYLIILPFWVWGILKNDKDFHLKLKIIFVLVFTYVIYKLSFSMIFFKFESLIKIFFISLKYKEKTYQKKVKSKVGEKFANYIGSELTQNKLMKKYAAI
jgi:hypothetical protein|nr:MAG TPA: hypothetical protein [Caudoviricetes sp.]